MNLGSLYAYLEALGFRKGSAGVTDHTLLTNIGVNTHAQIDTALTRLANTSGTNTGDQDLSGKQDTLVSGTSIKTINSTSLLGSGNIAISASPAGSSGSLQGNISGTFAAVPNWSFDTTTGAKTYTGGTVTASTPPLVLSQTVNNSAVNFEQIRVNLTNTASGSKAGVFAAYVGGVRKFNIDKNGFIGVSGPDIADSNPFTLSFSNNSGIHWNGSTIILAPSGTFSLSVTAAAVSAGVPLKMPSYTVATLPSASALGAGALAMGTDLSSLTNGSTATGSGSLKGLLKSDGSAWIVLG